MSTVAFRRMCWICNVPWSCLLENWKYCGIPAWEDDANQGLFAGLRLSLALELSLWLPAVAGGARSRVGHRRRRRRSLHLKIGCVAWAAGWLAMWRTRACNLEVRRELPRSQLVFWEKHGDAQVLCHSERCMQTRGMCRKCPKTYRLHGGSKCVPGKSVLVLPVEFGVILLFKYSRDFLMNLLFLLFSSAPSTEWRGDALKPEVSLVGKGSISYLSS